MNHVIFTKRLLSSISIATFFGLSSDVLAMNDEPIKISRDQHYRTAKVNKNYAEDSESPRNKNGYINQNQHDNSQLKSGKKKLISDLQEREVRKPIANTRGYYLGTDIPRLNLRPESLTPDNYLYLNYN